MGKVIHCKSNRKPLLGGEGLNMRFIRSSVILLFICCSVLNRCSAVASIRFYYFYFTWKLVQRFVVSVRFPRGPESLARRVLPADYWRVNNRVGLFDLPVGGRSHGSRNASVLFFRSTGRPAVSRPKGDTPTFGRPLNAFEPIRRRTLFAGF